MLGRSISPVALSLSVGILLLYYFFFVHKTHGSANKVFSGPPLNQSLGSFPDPYLPFTISKAKSVGSNYTRTLVVGHQKEESISWISEELPDINLAAYVVDDPQAPLHTPRNKGFEATVYLSYIIDHYDSLPDLVLFFHSSRHAWHNNVFHDRDSAAMIRAMRDDHVAIEGYFNVRCEHNPGCPDWLHLDRPEVDFDRVFKPEERVFTAQVWKEIWGNSARVPQVLSQPCCAQFAVTGQRIRLNPLSLYLHMRDWLLGTDLPSYDSGRVMEYTWQYLFTRLYEHCPPMNKCACAGYGVCFGSEEKMEFWLDLFYKREHLEDDLRKLKEEEEEEEEEEKSKPLIASGGGKEPKQEWERKQRECKEEIKVLTDEIEKVRHEAVQRGQDEKNIALERGRRVD